MQFATVVHCSKCHERIVSRQGFVFFKIPGKDGYQFFHCRFRAGGCWESYLKEHK